MYKNFFKRFLDLSLAILVLLILFPVYLFIFIILVILNNGKPFFGQDRIGRDEKKFRLIKFRSMNNKKDKDGMLLKDVDRLTRFGRFIRKTSLDELPQILNVVKGDMSFIGPRPLLPEYIPFYSRYHSRRHEVRPGITGLAQTGGRNSLKFSERFNLDVEYVDSISFFIDVKILYKTFLRLFTFNDIKLGRPMSEVDDIGITRGLAKHYFNIDENE